MKKLFFLGTGGLAHNLWLLGNCIFYAEKYQFKIYPILEISNSFRLNFYDLYTVKNKSKELFADKSELLNLKKIVFNEKTINIEDITLNHTRSFTYVIKDIKHQSDDLKLMNINFNHDFTTTGHFKTKQYFMPILARWHRWHYLRKSLNSLELAASIKKFILEKYKFLPNQYIGVHYRNTDMNHNFTYLYAKLRILAFFTQIKDIYWATDDYKSLVCIREKMPKINIINVSNTEFKAKEEFLNLHNLSDAQLTIVGINKKEQIMEAFSDVFILSKSTYFLSSRKSGLSIMVKIFRRKFSKNDLDFFQ